jgi:hypothetical protein
MGESVGEVFQGAVSANQITARIYIDTVGVTVTMDTN